MTKAEQASFYDRVLKNMDDSIAYYEMLVRVTGHSKKRAAHLENLQIMKEVREESANEYQELLKGGF